MEFILVIVGLIVLSLVGPMIMYAVCITLVTAVTGACKAVADMFNQN